MAHFLLLAYSPTLWAEPLSPPSTTHRYCWVMWESKKRYADVRKSEKLPLDYWS